ncbi:hypothetical protein CRUP_018955, partial [Coryphaenoides rupestris]
LQNYDATCRLAQEIAENIHERTRQQSTGGNPAKINMTLRASLQKLKQSISQLKESLLRASSSRRMSTLMSGSAGGSGGSGRGAVNPWLATESEETRGLSFGEIKQQQQSIIEAQDAGLDALAVVISRQKMMGREIGNELEEQNEIIDDLAHLVDKTDDRIRNETRRVKLVETKSASCAEEDTRD